MTDGSNSPKSGDSSFEILELELQKLKESVIQKYDLTSI